MKGHAKKAKVGQKPKKSDAMPIKHKTVDKAMKARGQKKV
jgi:hypothetical protein